MAFIGWCHLSNSSYQGMQTEKNYRTTVSEFLRSSAKPVVSKFLEPTSPWLAPAFWCHANDTQGVVEGCRVLVDTVPCTVENTNQSNVNYQCKYAANVVKKLGLLTVNGFFVEVGPPTLYTGASADNVILEHAKVQAFLQLRDVTCIADGGFTRTDRVETPFTKTEIWPEPRPSLKKKLDEYKAAAKTKLERNARLCFWRARVEHSFAESQLGRFKLLQRYTGHSSEKRA